MNYTSALRNLIVGVVLASAVAIVVSVSTVVGSVQASFEESQSATIQTSYGPQGLEHGDPEANLPYLFAVFFITWAAFFGYVFIMSRRQREMQNEIDVLKAVLDEREQQRTQAQIESESTG